MPITAKPYLTLRQIMENKPVLNIDVDKISIRDLLIDLAFKYVPEFRSMVFEDNSQEVGPHIRILINGKHYSTLPDKLDTILISCDEIGLFPPIAGG